MYCIVLYMYNIMYMYIYVFLRFLSPWRIFRLSVNVSLRVTIKKKLFISFNLRPLWGFYGPTGMCVFFESKGD